MKIKVPQPPLEFEAIKMNDPSEVKKGDRLFREIGYYPDPTKPFRENYIRTVEFSELDVLGFLEREKVRLQDKGWRDHHNFHIVRSE